MWVHDEVRDVTVLVEGQVFFPHDEAAHTLLAVPGGELVPDLRAPYLP